MCGQYFLSITTDKLVDLLGLTAAFFFFCCLLTTHSAVGSNDGKSFVLDFDFKHGKYSARAFASALDGLATLEIIA